MGSIDVHAMTAFPFGNIRTLSMLKRDLIHILWPDSADEPTDPSTSVQSLWVANPVQCFECPSVSRVTFSVVTLGREQLQSADAIKEM